jgi:hypothetical protein
LALPPQPIADAINDTATQFIEEKQQELREGLDERLGEGDPAYADAFVQALGRLAAAVRMALHADGVPA